MKHEIDGAGSTYGEEERFTQGYGGKPLVKETTWKTHA
jgi:hypothetical protein